MTVAVHHPYIQTLHTHWVEHWAAMKTGLSAGCGLSYQPLLPWSRQKNTNMKMNKLHLVKFVAQRIHHKFATIHHRSITNQTI